MGLHRLVAFAGVTLLHACSLVVDPRISGDAVKDADSGSPDCDNLLLSGSFDDHSLVGWSGNAASLGVVDGEGIDGTPAAELCTNADGFATMVAEVALDGIDVELTAAARFPSGSDRIRIHIQEGLANEERSIGQEWSTFGPIAHTATGLVTVDLRIISESGPGICAYFDNVCLQAAARR